MEVLFVFLKWVASFAHMDAETGSKMDLSNLATVICPSILYARGRDAMRDETFGALRVVTSLLENQDLFFTVPEEFLPILRDQEYFVNSLDLPGKEFMKKCDTYMRLKAQNGRPTPGPPFNGLNGNMPRYAPPSSSPSLDRPPLATPGQSDRTIRPHTGVPQHSNYSQSGSPSQSQGVLQQRPQQNDDWSPPTPRIPNINGSSSRPNSFSGQPRPSTEQQNAYNTPPNGYPSAVRQRT